MKTEQEYHYLTTSLAKPLYKANNPCIPCEIVVNLVVKNLQNRQVLDQSP
jgi:hypothetical protein